MTKTISEDEYLYDVKIDNSSMYNLMECIKRHSELEGKYAKILADAIKELDETTFQLEIVTAEIADEIFTAAEENGTPIPASGKDIVLKVGVKKDIRYQKLRKKTIELKHTVSILKGYSKGMDGRRYRLGEIFKVEERRLKGEGINSERGDETYNGEEKIVVYGDAYAHRFKTPEQRIKEMEDKLNFD